MEWEWIEERGDVGDTFRLPVPGGWLYRIREWGGDTFCVALTFVPGRHADD